jgi:predicted TIM-barrel fold metal-dependent hydrolase
VHALGHLFGQMISFAGMTFNGVFDKYPNVKFGFFMKGGVAWLLMCLERFDRSWETHVQRDPRKRFLDLKPKEKIREYIQRQIDAGRVFVGCEGEEPDIGHAIKRVGNKPFVYSTDYPHEVNNEFCKHEINELLENDEITDADKAALLHGNARPFYGLGAPGM